MLTTDSCVMTRGAHSTKYSAPVASVHEINSVAHYAHSCCRCLKAVFIDHGDFVSIALGGYHGAFCEQASSTAVV